MDGVRSWPLRRCAVVRGRPLLKLLHQPLRLALRVSIPLAQLSHELIALAGDDVNVLIGELAPLLTHFSLHDLPVAFELVLIHSTRSVQKEAGTTTHSAHDHDRIHAATWESLNGLKEAVRRLGGHRHR